MDIEQINVELERRLTGIRNKANYIELVKKLYEVNAVSRETTVKTKILSEIEKNASVYLKRLQKEKVVGVVKRGATKFLFNPAATNVGEKFGYIKPQIKLIREKNYQQLLKHIKEEVQIFSKCSIWLGLSEPISLQDIEDKIIYLDDKEKDRAQLDNFNLLVQNLKRENLNRKTYDELHWRRGSYSWYLLPEFVMEINMIKVKAIMDLL